MLQAPKTLTRRALAFFAVGLVVPTFSALAQTPAMIVHKDPTCGCCTGWVRHLKDAGFVVTVEETANLPAVRRRLGVPGDLAACHTAEIAGYVIEGHVPESAIRQLLQKRPVALGLHHVGGDPEDAEPFRRLVRRRIAQQAESLAHGVLTRPVPLGKFPRDDGTLASNRAVFVVEVVKLGATLLGAVGRHEVIPVVDEDQTISTKLN